MSDEVKMPIELRGMSPEECILLIQDTFKMHNATISRLTEAIKIVAHRRDLLEADLATAKKENERLKAVLDGAGYQNIDNLKNESVEKCRAIGSTAALLTIKAQSDLAAARKVIEDLRSEIESSQERTVEELV